MENVVGWVEYGLAGALVIVKAADNTLGVRLADAGERKGLTQNVARRPRTAQTDALFAQLTGNK